MLPALRVKIEMSAASKVKELIVKAQNILLVTHHNPDADAIGSLTAMALVLEKIHKSYIAFCYDEVPVELEFLPNSYQITSNLNELKQKKYDLVIVLDCASLERSGVAEELDEFRREGAEIINIDHHQTSNFGDINLVDSQASATAIILYDLFKFWQMEINKAVATSLLTGILVDTTNYSNSGTTPLAMEISADLIRCGANYGYITRCLYKNKTNKILNFWSKVLSRVKKNDKLKIVYTVILKEDLESLGLKSVENVVNFFNYIEDADLSIVLKELDSGQVKVSLRAIKEEINAAEIARFFGGGGHKKAAAFIINGRLEENKNGWHII